MQNTLVACTRCSLLSSLVVSDARWSCVANSRHGRAHSFSDVSAVEIPAVIVLPGFQGSEKNLQLTCVVSMPGICFKCVCGGCFLGYLSLFWISQASISLHSAEGKQQRLEFVRCGVARIYENSCTTSY